MKILLFINGPAGIGKTSLSQALHLRLTRSAWLQSEWSRCTNPFIYNAEMDLLTEKNMSFILRSYLECNSLRYVIFTWGLHGPRKAIFDRVIHNISDIEYNLLPITLMCDRDEHLRRLIQDGRDAAGIEGNLGARPFYESLTYPVVNTTNLTIEETADIVINMLDVPETKAI